MILYQGQVWPGWCHFPDFTRKNVVITSYSIHYTKLYENYTSDVDYLAEYGLEVLIAISRFWAQRVNWSDDKGKYVMLGVTGPNEYENNVNNNWYTNYIATWCLRYTLETIDFRITSYNVCYTKLLRKYNSVVLRTIKVWAGFKLNQKFNEPGE